MQKPKTIADWKKYYYAKVRLENNLNGLGKPLYQEISTTIKAELATVTEQDCIDYTSKTWLLDELLKVT